MKNLKKSLAVAGMAVSSVAGIGATMAPSADAASKVMYYHNSAHYKSQVECIYYRYQVGMGIKGGGGWIYTQPNCHKVANYWTYDSIMYMSTHAIGPTDKRAV